MDSTTKPSLNPIYMFSHEVKNKLRNEALQENDYETPHEFAERIQSTFCAIDQSYINKLISSMNDRIDKIINNVVPSKS